MEPNDEVVERQKLVPNDVETEEEPTSQVTTAPQSAPKSAPTPASPVAAAVPKINIKSISSGETTRSRNSASCSIERTTSDKGQASAKVTYVNERRARAQMHGGSGGGGINDDGRFEFKPRSRKLLKDEISVHNKNNNNNYNKHKEQQQEESHNNNNNNNDIFEFDDFEIINGSEVNGNDDDDDNDDDDTKQNANYNDADNDDDDNYLKEATSKHHTPIAQRRKGSATLFSLPTQSNTSALYPLGTASSNSEAAAARFVLGDAAIGSNVAVDHSDSFEERPIKHHSFVSEVPDVKHMERALLGLLDDFHSGKLKAFGFSAGSGCTMEQMTKIREQQESLAKLHFELAAIEEDSLENGSDLNNAVKAQENMLQLVQRLEQLSISIEQLQTSHNGL